MVSGDGFDVALVKLARPAIFEGGKVWPACLPRQGYRVGIGKECFITGGSHFGLVVVILESDWLPTCSILAFTAHFTRPVVCGVPSPVGLQICL